MKFLPFIHDLSLLLHISSLFAFFRAFVQSLCRCVVVFFFIILSYFNFGGCELCSVFNRWQIHCVYAKFLNIFTLSFVLHVVCDSKKFTLHFKSTTRFTNTNTTNNTKWKRLNKAGVNVFQQRIRSICIFIINTNKKKNKIRSTHPHTDTQKNMMHQQHHHQMV